MKTQNTLTEIHLGTVRAGLISLLVLALCFLWITGLNDLPRVWLFIVSFAVCFVLMLQSVVDLLVLAFGVAARVSGTTLGRSVRVIRGLLSHSSNSAW